MKTAFTLAAAIGLMLAGTAQAQSVDQRRANQQNRIGRGIDSGRLTPSEAARVERQQDRIGATEARMRARNGGYLTRSQRGRLQYREDRASNHIYRAKHNGRRY